MSDITPGIVLADDKGTKSLDLSAVDNAIIIPIDNGQGVLGVDVVGLTNSGATVVCEMQVGGTWRTSNMLVNGSGGAFSQSISSDAQFRSSAAAKWAARIRVTVAGSGSATVSWSLSSNSSLTQFASPLPPGANTVGLFGIAGSLPAFASPPAVTVTGSVSIVGTPAVAVSNFPASQPVTGTFWQATQPISGTVTANVTFPTSQAVTGTFWQATQPISAASLPLPSGAATATGVAAIVTTLGSPLQSGGAVSVSNFPATQAVSGTFWQATQPISAASLPLPTGAATASGVAAIVTTLGSPLQAGGTVVVTGVSTAAKQDAIITTLGSPLQAGGAVTVAGVATAAKQDAILAATQANATINSLRVPNGNANGGLTPKTTTNVSGFVANTAACNFYGAVVIGSTNGSAAYVLVMNRSTLPASGATLTQSEIFGMTGYSAGGGASLVPDQVPDRFSAGCVVLVTTSTTTYTPLTSNLPIYIKVRSI